MPIETERRFLIDEKLLPAWMPSEVYEQFYLSKDPVVRIRVIDPMDGRRPVESRLTIKGPGTLTRPEFEYTIPIEDARAMRPLGKSVIRKVRHHCDVEGHEWVVDQFLDKLAGLWLAEIELKSEKETFVRPRWVTKEVTTDPRYTNVYLAECGIPDPV